MASSTPTTHSVLTTTAHSIAQVLPAEIIEQIHKSLCAVEEDVHVGGFTRRGRRFAGVCSAWRNEALRRGEYVVNSLGQFENFVGFMEGDAASAKRAVGLNVRARFRNNADKIKRSALVKRLAALCVELSSLTLFVGEDTGSSVIRSENQPFVDGDVRTELAKLRRMKDFWMRGGKITLEQVRLLIASWPDLRRLNRPEIRFDSDHAVVAAQISQIPQSRLTTLIIDIDPPHSYSLISRLASGNTITELNLGLAYFPTKGQDDFIAVLTRLAPQLVTLDLEEHRSPSPVEQILPLLNKCRFL